jgi:hypothetical protein
MAKSVNTHNRLRYFLTNKIFLLQVMYRYVHTIFVVKCVTITRFFIACAALWWKSMIFILSSLETVHDTVQHRYCIFSMLYCLLRIGYVRIPYFHMYKREIERKYTVNVQCSVQYTLLLLFYLTLILLTWRIWWAPNNASKWQMGFNLAYKGLTLVMSYCAQFIN